MIADSYSFRRRACLLFLLMLAVWATFASGLVSHVAYAAEEGGGEAAAAGGEAAAPGGETPKQTKSAFVWVLESSGFIGFVILLLSIYFVATVARMFYELRLPVAMPPEIVGECEQLLEQRDFKGMFELVQGDDSLLSRLLTTGISELPNGVAEAREAMERVGEAATVEMEKKISMLAVLGTLGPMIGLLGTLKGMIASFSVIALSDTQLKASKVAGGISEALILTFEGVALSVPAIYFFALFRNRVSHMSVSTMLQADHLLRHFHHATREAKKPGAAPRPAAPNPAG